MSNSAQALEMKEGGVHVTLIPGSGNSENHVTSRPESSRTGRCLALFRDDKNHRKLAIWSIICGLSCIGCQSLIYSVKAEKTTDIEAAQEFSRKAKKFGIISIVTWISLLVAVPILIVLVSYLLTLID